MNIIKSYKVATPFCSQHNLGQYTYLKKLHTFALSTICIYSIMRFQLLLVLY